MFPTFLSALFTCTLTVPVLASAIPDPIIVRDSSLTLPFSRLLILEPSSGHTLYHRDLVRAQSFKARGDFREGSDPSKRDVISTPADNQVVSYVASVGVGSPPTQCRVIVCLNNGRMDLIMRSLFHRLSYHRYRKVRCDSHYLSSCHSLTCIRIQLEYLDWCQCHQSLCQDQDERRSQLRSRTSASACDSTCHPSV